MGTIGITGASGFIGSALTRALGAAGHEVRRIVRCSVDHGDGTLRWDPATGDIDEERFAEVDAVVHLAGANVAAGRWTPARRRAIAESRGPATERLCRALARLDRPPTFIGASAIGYYGDRGDELLTEDSAPGEGFLARVTTDWERGADPLQDRARVVLLRIGMVLGVDDQGRPGGALAKLRLPFGLGLGGRLGSGRQYVSWIGLPDLVALVMFALDHDRLTGAINAVAPGAVTNAEFTKAIGRVLRRPTILPVPAFALRLLLGQMADELLLASARVEPRRALESGFAFAQPEIEGALRAALT